MNAAVHKFEIGDPLSNGECKWLHRFFSMMESGCEALGADYGLFKRDITFKRLKVEDYLSARGLEIPTYD